jgi:CRISPR/Cas system CMR-associated protein Cmr5 small subunit
MKTRDQLRAERASSLVNGLKPEVLGEYVAEVRGFAAGLHAAGLGPSLAGIRARGTPAAGALYDHLGSWIAEAVYAEPKADLLSLVIANNAARLMRAHEEASAMCPWLRRFGEARALSPRKP